MKVCTLLQSRFKCLIKMINSLMSRVFLQERYLRRIRLFTKYLHQQWITRILIIMLYLLREVLIHQVIICPMNLVIKMTIIELRKNSITNVLVLPEKVYVTSYLKDNFILFEKPLVKVCLNSDKKVI